MTTIHSDTTKRRRPRRSLLGWLRQRHDAVQAEHRLRQLDDRLLRDIGLDRAGIGDRVRWG